MKINVSFSSSFRRAFKKRVKGKTDLEARFWAKVETFTNDPFEPSLRTHKLSGKLYHGEAKPQTESGKGHPEEPLIQAAKAVDIPNWWRMRLVGVP